MRWLFTIAVLWLFGVLCLTPTHASESTPAVEVGEQIAIKVGRRPLVRGELVKVDDRHVWIRRSLEGVSLTSRFPIDSITEWQTGDLTTVSSIRGPEPREANPSLPRLTAGAANRLQAPTSAAKIRSIRITADLGNWDGDLQADGLQVLVTPEGADRVAFPADGQITFKLLGIESPHRGRSQRTLSQQHFSTSRFRHERSRVRSDGFRTVELGLWTERLQEARLVAGGFVFELPFTRFDPEQSLAVQSEAVLVARLSVPGQGVFEAVSPTLFLRSYSSLRDQLQLQTGQRFFPQERRSRRN